MCQARFAAFATTDDEHFKVFRLGHFQLLVVREWRHADEHLDRQQLVRRNAVFKAKFLEYLSLVGHLPFPSCHSSWRHLTHA
jgi:hypothetical protein